MIPVRTPFFLPYLYPSLTWRMPSDEKKIYLTFDDGPVPGPTEFVLKTLASRSVKATFFCIGDNIRKHSGVFDTVVAGGHTVGNHTFHHINGWRTSTSDYIRDVEACTGELKRVRNADTRLCFRPPYGRIKRSQARSLSGYRIIMWDVLTQDFDRAILPETCLRKSIAATRNGSIIVFHDSFKAEKNLSFVLPRFVDHFGGLGFEFSSL
jgi:peptidoglycan-N-acetylglucosamine deacetylase